MGDKSAFVGIFMELTKYNFRDLVIDSRTGLNPRKNFTLGTGENNYITIKDIKDGEIFISDKTESTIWLSKLLRKDLE